MSERPHRRGVGPRPGTRPSAIALQATVGQGVPRAVETGVAAVVVSEGVLHV